MRLAENSYLDFIDIFVLALPVVLFGVLVFQVTKAEKKPFSIYLFFASALFCVIPAILFVGLLLDLLPSFDGSIATLLILFSLPFSYLFSLSSFGESYLRKLPKRAQLISIGALAWSVLATSIYIYLNIGRW